MSKLTGYVIGDTSEPGSYTRVSGTFLQDESCFDCESEEDFHIICRTLRENCDYESNFALVEQDEYGNREIIDWD